MGYAWAAVFRNTSSGIPHCSFIIDQSPFSCLEPGPKVARDLCGKLSSTMKVTTITWVSVIILRNVPRAFYLLTRKTDQIQEF